MQNTKRDIYMDNAAGTALDPRVLAVMEPFFALSAANPSSIHDAGVAARKAVAKARDTVAAALGAHHDEIVFTSGGTESNNLAILGAARAAGRGAVVTCAIEHQSVLRPIRALEKEGFSVAIVSVDGSGRVSSENVAAAITPETVLVSIQFANNELGTIQPVAEIGKMIKRLRKNSGRAYPLFHVDACQAVGACDIDVEKLGVDLLTVNGSKVYGPKGVGALFVRRGVKIAPLMFGGSQESSLRPGTENVAGIVGLAEALRLAAADRGAENARLSGLRDELAGRILKIAPTARVNCADGERLPGTLHVSFPGRDGEALLIYLSAAGVHCSTGAACEASSDSVSHVLAAIGMDAAHARGAIRFSLGRFNDAADIDALVASLPDALEKTRFAGVDAKTIA